MPVPGIEHRKLRSYDGTEIAYQVRGPESAAAIVLTNGLGGTYQAFRHLYDLVDHDRRVICWDYRGLYRSGRPADPSALSIPHHARDLVQLLAAERIERAVFVGWSMGVQVNFEIYREHPELFEALVVLNGTYGRPFSTALGGRAARYLIPLAINAMQKQAQALSFVARRTAGWRGMMPLLQRLRLIGPTMDGDVFEDLAGEFLTLDFHLYGEIMRWLGEHDAADVLLRVRVPTLVITGDRDFFTPVSTAQRIARTIPGARLVIVEGGTHYTAVEHPEVVVRELGRFLAELPSAAARTVGVRTVD